MSSNRYALRKRHHIDYRERSLAEDIRELRQAREGEELRDLTVTVKRRRTEPPTKSLPRRNTFPFMKLPAELRNRIYAECLTGWQSVADFEDRRSSMWEKTDYKLESSLVSSNTRRSSASLRSLCLLAQTDAFKTNAKVCAECKVDGAQRWGPAHARYLGWFERKIWKTSPPSAADREAEERQANYDSTPFLVPQLLAVSKQVQAEASSILYGQRLVFLNSAALIPFLLMIGPNAAKQLRHIEVRGWGRNGFAEPAAAFLALSGTTNLETFRIYGYEEWFGLRRSSRATPDRIGKRAAQKIFQNLYPLFQAIGKARRDPSAGISVLQLSRDRCGMSARFDEVMAVFRWEMGRLISTL